MQEWRGWKTTKRLQQRCHPKDKQALKRDYNLVEFSINTAEDFKKAVKKDKGIMHRVFQNTSHYLKMVSGRGQEEAGWFPRPQFIYGDVAEKTSG